MASNSIGTASIEIEADADEFASDAAKEAGTAGAKGGKEFSESFKQNTGAAALGTFIGNALLGAVQSAMGAVKGLISEALVQSDAIDKFKSTLSFAGLDTGTIDALTAKTKAYADATVYGLSDIQSITAQLAANGVAGYDSLAEAAGNLNAIAGGTADTYSSVGMVLTQTAGAGKLVTENWNQLANAIPGASGVLQDALLQAGAYTGNFRDAMAAGEITAEEFNAAIMQVGSDPIAVEAARSTVTFEGAIGNLQAALLTLTTDLVNKVKPAVTEAINAIASGVTVVSDFVAGINSMSDIGALFSQLSGMRDQLIGNILDALPGIVEAIVSFIPTAISTIVDSSVSMWLAIVEGLSTALPQIIDAIASALPQIVGALVAAIPTILAGAQQMFQGIITALTTIIPLLIQTIITLIPQIISALITALPQLIAGAISLFQGIITGLTTAIPLILAAVLQLLPMLASTLVGMLPTLVESAIQLFMALIEGVITIAPDLISAVLLLLPQLINTLLSMLPGIIQSAITLFLGIVTGILGALPQILVAIIEMLPSFISSILQMIPQLITAAITLFLGIVTGVVEATPKIIRALWDLIPQLVTALVDAAPQLLDAGVQAMQGFIDGIVSMAGSIWDAAVGVVEGAIDGVKDFLGIHSPSRLLKGIGENTMEGYIEGVDDLAGAAQKAMTDAMTPPDPIPLSSSLMGGLGRPGQSGSAVAASNSGGYGASGNDNRQWSTVEAGAVQVIGPDPYAAANEVANKLAERAA